MCYNIISEDPFSIKIALDQNETQKMCDKTVDYCLAALKFVPDWFVTSKMIKRLFTALYADENILFFNEYFGNVIISSNEMGVLNIDLNNINLGNTNYEEYDSDTIIHIRRLSWHIEFEKRKEKLSEDLMPKAWHPNRWRNFFSSEDKKKEIDPIFIEGL